MGLDIVAYTKVELIKDMSELPRDELGQAIDDYIAKVDDADSEDLGVSVPSVEYLEPSSHFPHSAVGLIPGMYTVEGHYHFRAGSYSIYNVWRESLASMIKGLSDLDQFWNDCREDPELVNKTIFGTLLNFTDCDGVLYGSAITSLKVDFITMADKAKKHFSGYEYAEHDMDKYTHWKNAFIHAAPHGAVIFR